MSNGGRSKILNSEAALEWVRRQHAQGLTVGFTCGAFDILHAGHVSYLAKAKELCDCLLVAVNSDASIQTYKSPYRPYVPEEYRMLVVAALECVDAVVRMDATRPIGLLQAMRPDFYIKGGDYSPSQLKSGTFVESYGGQVKVIPTGVDLSTSKVVETILLREAHARPEATPPVPSRGIVFLDRDGTVIENVPYLHEPEKVKLLPGVGEGLARLQSAGFRLVIVTNQQGIGLGFYTPRQYVAVNEALLRALAPHRVTISRIYHCPHSREEGCRCRKPATGMLERGLLELNEHPARCFLVGDTPSDMQAASTAGIRGVGVGGSELPGASATFADFLQAVDWILSQPAAASLEAHHAR